MKHYKIIISETSKMLGDKEGFRCYHEHAEKFKTLEDVRQYLKENYEGKTRQKIYRGEGEHVGFIYKMGIQTDYEHGEKFSYYRQDWVEVREVREKTLVIIKF